MISLVRDPSSIYYSPNTKFLLLTPPPVDEPVRTLDLASRAVPLGPDRDAERTRLFAEAVKEVGREAGVPVVDTWTGIMQAAEREGGLERYLVDGLHLSAEGYRVVFEG